MYYLLLCVLIALISWLINEVRQASKVLESFYLSNETVKDNTSSTRPLEEPFQVGDLVRVRSMDTLGIVVFADLTYSVCTDTRGVEIFDGVAESDMLFISGSHLGG